MKLRRICSRFSILVTSMKRATAAMVPEAIGCARISMRRSRTPERTLKRQVASSPPDARHFAEPFSHVVHSAEQIDEPAVGDHHAAVAVERQQRFAEAVDELQLALALALKRRHLQSQ